MLFASAPHRLLLLAGVLAALLNLPRLLHFDLFPPWVLHSAWICRTLADGKAG